MRNPNHNKTRILKESARKLAGPRIIRTSRFQIIDKTNVGQPDEVSNIEHIEMQESNVSAPADSDVKQMLLSKTRSFRSER